MNNELEKLLEGNKRYVEGKLKPKNFETQRNETVAGQKPFAIIVSCSDSRVVPEFIFDVGIGEVFTIATAGNVCDSIAIGSIEYAIEHLHTQLVVVMGHEKCGAINAAYQGGDHGPNINAIIKKIKPAIRKREVDECIECNVKDVIQYIKNNSKIITDHENQKKLKIVGMKYSLQTGKISVLSD